MTVGQGLAPAVFEDLYKYAVGAIINRPRYPQINNNQT